MPEPTNLDASHGDTNDLVLSIVMPVYNEKESIESAVKEVQDEVMSKIPQSELIVVEGSNDGTADILDRMAAADARLRIIHEPPRGHGPALITGLNAGKGEYLFMIDGDMQIPASCFDLLWNEIKSKNLDAAFGIRQSRHDPLTRLILTKFVRVLILMLCGTFIKDSNVPFKIIRRRVWTEAAKVIPPTTLTPSIFLAIFIKKRGCSLATIPIVHRERLAGESTIRHWSLLKACYKALGQLVEFRKGLRSTRV